MNNLPPKPLVCKFLNCLAFLSIVLGVIGSIPFFTNQSYQTSGVVSQPLIIPAIAVILGGIIGAVLFRAVAEIILFLQTIHENLLIVASKFVDKPDATSEQSQ